MSCVFCTSPYKGVNRASQMNIPWYEHSQPSPKHTKKYIPWQTFLVHSTFICQFIGKCLFAEKYDFECQYLDLWRINPSEIVSAFQLHFAFGFSYYLNIIYITISINKSVQTNYAGFCDLQWYIYRISRL